MPPIFLHELTQCLPVRDDTAQPQYCPANHQVGYTCPINRCQYGLPPPQPPRPRPTVETVNSVTSGSSASCATQTTPISLFPTDQSIYWYEDEHTIPPSTSSTVTTASESQTGTSEQTVTSYGEQTVTSYGEETVATNNPCPANMVCCPREMCQGSNPNPGTTQPPPCQRPIVETVTSVTSGSSASCATQTTPITLFPEQTTADNPDPVNTTAAPSAAPCQAEFDAYSNCLSQQPTGQQPQPAGQQSSHTPYIQVPPVISVPNYGGSSCSSCTASYATGTSGIGSYFTAPSAATSGTGSYATCMLPNDDCIQECAKFRDYMRQKGCPNTVVCRNRPDPSIRRQRKRRATDDCDDCVLVKRC